MNASHDGEDMSLETFRNALDYDEYVTLGGGEPTLHPLFWQFFGEALAVSSEYLWLATNGSIKNTALALAKLAKKGVIGCALSQDNYHDPIDPEVIEAFTKDKRQSSAYSDRTPDSREIRNVTGNEINAGRCDFGKNGCACEDIIIEPDGTVRACGCEDAPTFGNINTEVNIPDDWEQGTCHKEQPGAK